MGRAAATATAAALLERRGRRRRSRSTRSAALVREGGDAALLAPDQTLRRARGADAQRLRVDPADAAAALAAIDPELRAALETAAANIRAVAEAQLRRGAHGRAAPGPLGAPARSAGRRRRALRAGRPRRLPLERPDDRAARPGRRGRADRPGDAARARRPRPPGDARRRGALRDRGDLRDRRRPGDLRARLRDRDDRAGRRDRRPRQRLGPGGQAGGLRGRSGSTRSPGRRS